MTEATKVTKDEILEVCRSLKAFEKRLSPPARYAAGRLRANLHIAAIDPRPGLGFVLAEQVEALRQEAARRE